jgi:transforming growth factor-beta-induced protein
MVRFTFATTLIVVISLSCAVTEAQNSTPPSFDDIIAADKNFTSLNGLVNVSGSKLSDRFTDAVTLFAPNDNAFTNVGLSLAKYFGDQFRGHLENLLAMHVVKGKVFSYNLTDGQVVTAFNGENITVSIASGKVTLATANSSATVVNPDVESSGGVLHQIDNILLPSFVNTGLLDLAGNPTGFTAVNKLLQFAGLGALFTANLTATVFAPSDEAFEALGAGALDYFLSSKSVATRLLSGHVLSPLILPTQNMKDGPISATTPIMTTLSVTITELEGVKVYKINNATIETTAFANNGIIHQLSKVLVVPGAEYPPLNKPAPTPVPPPSRPASGAASISLVIATLSTVGYFFIV